MRAGRLSDEVAAWACARLLAGGELPTSIDIAALGSPWAGIIPPLARANGEGRKLAFQEAMAVLPNAKELAAAVYAADPDTVPLAIRAPATWADLAVIIPDVEWTWSPWLPRGLLTLLVGKAGSGKSALALALASAIIQGKDWPDGMPGPDEGKIVWAETEAAQAVNLERAKTWGLPLEEVIIPDLGDPLADLRLDDPDGWEALERAAHRPEVELVIVDSLRGAFRGDENSSDCVQLLTKLAALARDARLPLLVIHHLRKKAMFDDDKIELDRVRGSSVITQLARVVWAIDRPDPLMPNRVRLSMIKNNLARFPEPVGFEITQAGVTFGAAPEEPQVETQRDKAADLLLTLLREGPVLSEDIYVEGEGAAISKATLRRTKKALGIVAIRKERQWWWSLPPQMPQET